MSRRMQRVWKSRSTRAFCVLTAVLLFWGCSSPSDTNNSNSNTNSNTNQTNSTEPADHRVKVPEAPAKEDGLQFVQPETIIKAGEEKQVCWVPNWVPDKDYYISAFKGFQSKMGHHVVALRSSVPRKPGTQFDCTNLEQMTAIRPLVLTDFEERRLLPKGYAVRLPKDTKIVIQSHYVNTSSKDIKIADVAQFEFHKGEKPTEASYFILNHGAINLPQGAAKASVSCTVKNKLNILLLFGHMHEYGTSLNIMRERAGESKQIYEVKKWTVDYRDAPPITFYGDAVLSSKEPAQEITFEKGDRITINCNYDNTTKGPLRFPAEMCSMVAYYHSQETNEIIVCDEDN